MENIKLDFSKFNLGDSEEITIEIIKEEE